MDDQDFEKIVSWLGRYGKEFSTRLLDATNVDEKRFRCSGWEKRIVREVLKELAFPDSEVDLFLAYAASLGGKCCDCEIGFNVFGCDDDELEIHHVFVPGVSVYSAKNAQAVCECCHSETHTVNIRH